MIKNYEYVHEINKLKWLKGSIEGIKFLNKCKIKVIVITNQSGIAWWYFTEKELLDFHYKMNQMLFKSKAKIDSFYYCSYHSLGKIKKYRKKTNINFQFKKNYSLDKQVKK